MHTRMSNSLLVPLLSIIVLGLWACGAGASVATKVTQEILEEALEKIAVRSGGKIAGREIKEKALLEAMERLGRTYGDDVLLRVVREGGEEALEAAVKYGDDVVEIFQRSSPAARRALTRSLPELLPLARRVGVEALELEAKAPGLATGVFRVFGDDVGKAVAKSVPVEDLPRLLHYAEKADSAATRNALWRRCQKEGVGKALKHLPRFIVAGGLTTAMLYGVHRVTEPYAADAENLREDGKNGGELAKSRWHHATNWGGGIAMVIALMLLWRFRLMPWHGKRRPPEGASQIQSSELR